MAPCELSARWAEQLVTQLLIALRAVLLRVQAVEKAVFNVISIVGLAFRYLGATSVATMESPGTCRFQDLQVIILAHSGLPCYSRVRS